MSFEQYFAENGVDVILGILLILAGLYGSIRLFRKKVPLYFKIMVCAVLLSAFGALYNLLCYAITADWGVWMYLGEWANIGTMIFFLTANYGQFDSIIDGGNPKMKKARLLALIGPFVLLTLHVPCFFLLGNDHPVYIALLSLAETVFSVPAAYFSLKVLLIKDKDDFFLKGAKPINALILVYLVVHAISLLITMAGNEPAGLAVHYLVILALIGIVFAADWGCRQWKTR